MTATSPDAVLSNMTFVLDPGPSEVVLGAASGTYYIQWPVYGISPGSHTVVARAVRGALHTDSAPVTVNIQAAVAAPISQKSGVVLYNNQSVNGWNTHPEIRQAILTDQNPRWWRNYVQDPEGVINPLPGGGYFVPMLTWPADHGPDFPSSVTPARIATAVANAQGGYIAMFTEFDGQGFTVAEAVAGYHTAMADSNMIAFRAGGGKIISPYTVEDGSGAGSKFRQFLSGIAANGDPDPDEYALDKYGGAGTTIASVNAVMARVLNFHAAWPAKQLWLQEYDMILGQSQAEDAQQIDFMTQMRAQLDALPYVTSDLWFYGGPKQTVPTFANVRAAALYNDDGTITIAGTAWKQLGR